jgi:hypothetical protein
MFACVVHLVCHVDGKLAGLVLALKMRNESRTSREWSGHSRPVQLKFCENYYSVQQLLKDFITFKEILPDIDTSLLKNIR